MRYTIFLGALLVLLVASFNAHASKVYKWVDKDGKTHYSNTPPPEASNRERTVLDKHGNVTATLSAPRTPEEIAADRERKAERAEKERLAKEQAAKDHMLLQTYTATEEMEMARDGRLAALEAQVRVASGAISSLESHLAQLDERAAGFRNNGKPVPEQMQKNIEKTRRELLENQKFLIARQQEQEEIRQRFAADIARFKELKGLK